MLFVMCNECHMISVGFKSINISASQLYKSPVTFALQKAHLGNIYLSDQNKTSSMSYFLRTDMHIYITNKKKLIQSSALKTNSHQNLEITSFMITVLYIMYDRN